MTDLNQQSDSSPARVGGGNADVFPQQPAPSSQTIDAFAGAVPQPREPDYDAYTPEFPTPEAQPALEDQPAPAKKRRPVLSIVLAVLLVAALVTVGVLVGEVSRANENTATARSVVEDRDSEISALEQDLDASEAENRSNLSRATAAEASARAAEAKVVELEAKVAELEAAPAPSSGGSDAAFLAQARSGPAQAMRFATDDDLLSVGNLACENLALGGTRSELISLGVESGFGAAEVSNMISAAEQHLC